MRLGIYARTSTGNPTGRRPWNSRLSFYIPNTFALPTTGRGPFLLQPGVTGRPMQAGGVPGFMTPPIVPLPTPAPQNPQDVINALSPYTTDASFISTVAPGLAGLGCASCSRGLSGVSFPNFPSFQRPRSSRRRFDSMAPLPVYTRPVPTAVSAQLSGMGQTEILGLSVDPTMLALGAAALLAAFYLIGSGRPKRKARRLRKKISRAQSQLRALAV